MDTGTGSGQAAAGLAAFFDRVVATDASAGQIAAAARHDRVLYVRAAAEAAPVASASADLVTAAQALHWFDTAAFFREAGRVLVPGGVVAVWCYDLPSVSPTVDAVLNSYYSDVVGPYWAPERRLVEDAYRTIAFPFEEIETPPITIEAAITLDEITGYAGTWSASLAYVRERGADPVAGLRSSLLEHWPDPLERRIARWPVTVRAGRTATPTRRSK